MSADPQAAPTSRERIVMLQTGFNEGQRFLAAWQAWRAACDDPQRSARLVFIAIEPQPPTHTELAAAHRASPWPDLVDALLAAWPPLTPNLHRLSFDAGRVQLLLRVAEVQAGVAELVARVDRFWLDGPARGLALGSTQAPGLHLCKALGRLAAPGALLSASSANSALRAGLTTAGFSVHAPLPGECPQSALQATFAPSFTQSFGPSSRRHGAPSRSAAPRSPNRRALIVGAGLAGCAAAWALAEQGWHSSVLERRAQIASEGSGNPAGLFHGIVNAQDGLHARFNRAAALEAQRAVQLAIDAHGVPGSTGGLLRLESTLDLRVMQSTLARLGLPPDYAQALDAAAASARAGIPLVQPAWYYPGAGWVDPGGLARSFLERAAGHAALRTGAEVHALERSASGWRLLDAHGDLIDAAEVVVLANAGDAMRLLADAGPAMVPMVPMVPITRSRGQISTLPAAALPFAAKLPITGTGYLLPESQGRVIFGATSQAGDADASVREADHRLNLAQLQRLTGWQLDIDLRQLGGRTAWRWVTADRLPVIGAVPDLNALADPRSRGAPCPAPRLDQPRFVPRLPGLFMFTGLGSRGVTWCALGAQVLAASVAGAPVPLEARLLDAIDPARFIVRRARRSGAA